MPIQKTIKTLIFIAFIAIFTSCSNDNGPNFQTEVRSIDSIAIPDTVDINKDYEFKLYYEKLGSCDEFAGFDAQLDTTDEEGEEITYVITAFVNVYDRTECQQFEEPEIVREELLFRADEERPYYFKFWQGVDQDEVPIFLEKTVYVKGVEDATETRQ